MRKRHGWSKRSDMPAKYVHLVNADVDNAILMHYGMKEDDDIASVRVPKICRICEMPNTPDSTKCSKCGKALDLQTALELEELEKEEKNNLEKKVDKLTETVSSLENFKEEMRQLFKNKMDELPVQEKD